MSNDEARDTIIKLAEGYKRRKKDNRLYSEEDNIPNTIIRIYYNSVIKPHFKKMVETYKRAYIYNESRVEEQLTKAEKMGLGEVYDYISNFDYEHDKFNIFVCSMVIHQLLYSKCPNKSFGGELRSCNAMLKDTNYEVINPEEAKKLFNDFIPADKNNIIFQPLVNDDILGYINVCVQTTVDLIKWQPFNDGNKRTFRALLNLMLKRIDIPPIYIDTKEVGEYKEALLDAIVKNNYKPITRFYYYKICDAIMELDVNNSEIKEEVELQFKR